MLKFSEHVEADLQDDGVTLRLAKKLSLPPGKVHVIVQPSSAAEGPDVLEILEQIHQRQQERGRKPMTEEEMEREIAALRAEDDEYEARWREISSQTQRPNSRESS